MSQPDQASIDRWHRWFAVECNNRGWDLVNQAWRTPAEDDEMLASAHAAALHWSNVGEPINDARAAGLLAAAHAQCGRGDEAMRWARRYLTHCQQYGCEDWDLAFAHAAVAGAAAALADTALHAEQHAQAQRAGETIAAPEQRAIFFDQFERLATAPQRA
ncbi:MAG: hypothetical protein WD009_08465 [Phycisphaeraceae bacterium]